MHWLYPFTNLPTENALKVLVSNISPNIAVPIELLRFTIYIPNSRRISFILDNDPPW